MAVETADDRAIFFGTDDFGITAVYFPLAGGQSNVNGIFDNEFIEVDVGGNIGVAMQQKRFVCRTADVPNAAENDQFRINGLDHFVRIVQDDGTGITTFVLEVPA